MITASHALFLGKKIELNAKKKKCIFLKAGPELYKITKTHNR